MKAVVSCGSSQQSCDSEQIVGGADQIGVHLHPPAAAVARLAQTADGFHPAEGLLDSFTYPLADCVTRMTSGPRVESGTSGPRVILCHVRGDIEPAAGRDELARVIALIAAQRDSMTARQSFIDHCHRRPPLGQAVGRLDLKLTQQRIAVLHQRVGRVAKLGFLALTLACQQRLRVGSRLMRRIGPLLAMEVHSRITRIIRSRARLLTLALEALKRSPGLDQRTVDREVVVREQSPRLRLRHYLPEEVSGDLVFQQTVAVGRKARMVKARLVPLQIQKPAEQQIVVELFAEHPLAANRIQRHQQRGLEQTLGRNRRPPQWAVHLLEDRRQLLERGIGHLLDTPQRMLLGNSLFQVDHHQHRPLPPLLPAHPPSPPPPPLLPSNTNYTRTNFNSTKINFMTFSTACLELECDRRRQHEHAPRQILEREEISPVSEGQGSGATP